MRWNCPHCAVSLSVPEDKLGTGWTFSRCYKCSGFALVRRSDVNLIKIDGGPEGELDLRAVPQGPSSAALATAAAESQLRQARPTPTKTASELPSALPDLPEFHAQEGKARSIRAPRPLSAAIAVAATAAMISGIYLYQQGQEVWRRARHAAVTAPQPAAAAKTAAAPAAPAQSQALAPAPAQAQVQPPAQGTQLASGVVTDQIRSHAMAPLRPAASEARLLVQPRIRNAAMRGGPGLEYPIVGLARMDVKYVVHDWSDRWFKVVIENPNIALQPTASSVPGHGRITAWIRNDLVQLIPGDLKP